MSNKRAKTEDDKEAKKDVIAGRYQFYSPDGKGDCTTMYLTNIQQKQAHVIHIDFGFSAHQFGKYIIPSIKKDMETYTIENQYIIVTHFDTDHFRGLGMLDKTSNVQSIVKELNGKKVYWMAPQHGRESKSGEALNIIANLKQNATETTDHILNVADKCVLQCICKDGRVVNSAQGGTSLKPENETSKTGNDSSIGFIVHLAGKKIYCAGDLTEGMEQTLVDSHNVNMKNVDIMKVSHHGSATSTPIELLKILNPIVVVIPVGSFAFTKAGYYHPRFEVLQKLNDFYGEKKSRLKKVFITANPNENIRNRWMRNASSKGNKDILKNNNLFCFCGTKGTIRTSKVNEDSSDVKTSEPHYQIREEGLLNLEWFHEKPVILAQYFTNDKKHFVNQILETETFDNHRICWKRYGNDGNMSLFNNNEMLIPIHLKFGTSSEEQQDLLVLTETDKFKLHRYKRNDATGEEKFRLHDKNDKNWNPKSFDTPIESLWKISEIITDQHTELFSSLGILTESTNAVVTLPSFVDCLIRERAPELGLSDCIKLDQIYLTMTPNKENTHTKLAFKLRLNCGSDWEICPGLITLSNLILTLRADYWPSRRTKGFEFCGNFKSTISFQNSFHLQSTSYLRKPGAGCVYLECDILPTSGEDQHRIDLIEVCDWLLQQLPGSTSKIRPMLEKIGMKGIEVDGLKICLDCRKPDSNTSVLERIIKVQIQLLIKMNEIQMKCNVNLLSHGKFDFYVECSLDVNTPQRLPQRWERLNQSVIPKLGINEADEVFQVKCQISSMSAYWEPKIGLMMSDIKFDNDTFVISKHDSGGKIESAYEGQLSLLTQNSSVKKFTGKICIDSHGFTERNDVPHSFKTLKQSFSKDLYVVKEFNMESKPNEVIVLKVDIRYEMEQNEHKFIYMCAEMQNLQWQASILGEEIRVKPEYIFLEKSISFWKYGFGGNITLFKNQVAFEVISEKGNRKSFTLKISLITDAFHQFVGKYNITNFNGVKPFDPNHYIDNKTLDQRMPCCIKIKMAKTGNNKGYVNSSTSTQFVATYMGTELRVDYNKQENNSAIALAAFVPNLNMVGHLFPENTWLRNGMECFKDITLILCKISDDYKPEQQMLDDDFFTDTCKQHLHNIPMWVSKSGVYVHAIVDLSQSNDGEDNTFSNVSRNLNLSSSSLEVTVKILFDGSNFNSVDIKCFLPPSDTRIALTKGIELGNCALHLLCNSQQIYVCVGGELRLEMKGGKHILLEGGVRFEMQKGLEMTFGGFLKLKTPIQNPLNIPNCVLQEAILDLSFTTAGNIRMAFLLNTVIGNLNSIGAIAVAYDVPKSVIYPTLLLASISDTDLADIIFQLTGKTLPFNWLIKKLSIKGIELHTTPENQNLHNILSAKRQSNYSSVVNSSCNPIHLEKGDIDEIARLFNGMSLKPGFKKFIEGEKRKQKFQIDENDPTYVCEVQKKAASEFYLTNGSCCYTITDKAAIQLNTQVMFVLEDTYIGETLYKRGFEFFGKIMGEFDCGVQLQIDDEGYLMVKILSYDSQICLLNVDVDTRMNKYLVGGSESDGLIGLLLKSGFAMKEMVETLFRAVQDVYDKLERLFAEIGGDEVTAAAAGALAKAVASSMFPIVGLAFLPAVAEARADLIREKILLEQRRIEHQTFKEEHKHDLQLLPSVYKLKYDKAMNREETERFLNNRNYQDPTIKRSMEQYHAIRQHTGLNQQRDVEIDGFCAATEKKSHHGTPGDLMLLLIAHIAGNDRLGTLRLENNTFDDDGAGGVMDTLVTLSDDNLTSSHKSSIKNLGILSFEGTPIGGHLHKCEPLWNTHLRELNLGRCNIDENAIRKCETGLNKLTGLEVFNIEHNGIVVSSGGAADVFSSIMKRNQNLTHVRMGGNRFNAKGLLGVLSNCGVYRRDELNFNLDNNIGPLSLDDLSPDDINNFSGDSSNLLQLKHLSLNEVSGAAEFVEKFGKMTHHKMLGSSDVDRIGSVVKIVSDPIRKFSTDPISIRSDPPPDRTDPIRSADPTKIHNFLL